MKRFGLFLILVTSPAWATWSLVQNHAASCTAGSNTCTQSALSATGAGNLLAVVMAADVADTISSVSGGGSWTLCSASGCQSNDTGASTRDVDIAYNLSASAGATSVTVTRSSSTSSAWMIEVLEYSTTAPSFSLDVFGVRQQTTSGSTTFAGVTLTLSGSNDVIIQAARMQQNATAITSPYTDPAVFSTHSGFAGSLNTASGTAPTWTTNSGSRGALSAIAFQEGAAATSVRHRAICY